MGTGAVLGAGGAWHFANEKTTPGQPFPARMDAGSGTVLNDASLLSPTRVAKHIVMKSDPTDELIAGLRAELAEAKSAGRPFVVSAARHSMAAPAACIGVAGPLLTICKTHRGSYELKIVMIAVLGIDENLGQRDFEEEGIDWTYASHCG